jgi:hypothetical protein
MSQLLSTFQDAVIAFNDGDYDTTSASLSARSHDDVVMNKVDDPRALPFSGRHDVFTYLNTYQKAPLPQFNYKPDSTNPTDVSTMKGPDEAPVGTDTKAGVLHAQISGIGKYQDVSGKGTNKNVTDPYYVRYFFLFRRESNSWQLVHATATPL